MHKHTHTRAYTCTPVYTHAKLRKKQWYNAKATGDLGPNSDSGENESGQNT